MSTINIFVTFSCKKGAYARFCHDFQNLSRFCHEKIIVHTKIQGGLGSSLGNYIVFSRIKLHLFTNNKFTERPRSGLGRILFVTRPHLFFTQIFSTSAAGEVNNIGSSRVESWLARLPQRLHIHVLLRLHLGNSRRTPTQLTSPAR